MSQHSPEYQSIKSSKLIFISTTRLHYDSNGQLRSYNPLLSAEEWKPFEDKFEHITILARIDVTNIADEGYIVDESKFRVVAIPFYDGTIDYYRKRHRVISFISKYITDPQAFYYLWVPSPIALPTARRVKKIAAPLIVRVMGDPAGVAKSIFPFPANLGAARIAEASARRTVSLADGVVYVTLSSLQKLYPPRKNAIEVARTNVQFSPELLSVPQQGTTLGRDESVKVIAVGSQEQNYKGHDLLIKAIARLQKQGYESSLTLVGDGRFHHSLKALAQQETIKNIEFIKHVGSSSQVAHMVSQHDLFVMPSRTEGMPKALLEAMSVGVVAVGSQVGGIPEILDEEATFPPNSVDAIVETVRAISSDRSLALRQRKKQAEMVHLVRTKHSGNAVLSRFIDEVVDRAL